MLNNSKRQNAVLTLVFPKVFEFFKFLQYLFLKSYYAVTDFVQLDDYEFHIYLMELSGNSLEHFKLPILLINQSDINFYSIFSKLVRDDIEEYHMLIGSCGSSDAGDLGKSFLVSKATKGDRGHLDENGHFALDTSKIMSKECHLLEPEKIHIKQLVSGAKAICSTNFLNLNIIHHSFQYFLFDMETYDFFDVCSRNGVNHYGCVRFVTDYVMPREPDVGSIDAQINLKKSDFIKEKPHWGPFDLVALNEPEESEKLKKLEKLKRWKKYFRLRVDVDFNFVFSLARTGNVVKPVCFNGKNIQKYYAFFLWKYTEKLSETLGPVGEVDHALQLFRKQTETEALSRNFEKAKRLGRKFNYQCK